ncbi:MAG: flagellar filament capping protein FliD [Lachnospiraceae bacterium]|nr:flagellar filament capping protein FliD [Lachnospiraceae bacterium]
MPVRLTGMVSGMDTDTLIQQLVSAKQSKIDDIKGKKTKLEWQKEAWADMNKKVYSFYTGSLSKIKSQSTYKTKKATSTDDSKVEVKANANAVVGSHSIEVQSVASSTYLTSGKIATNGYEEKYSKAVTSSDVKLSEMNNASDLVGKSLTVKIGEGDTAETKTYTFTEDSTIADVQAAFGSDVEVTLKDGKLSIANKTATKVTDGDGNETYENGKTINVTGDALEFFGVSADDGVTLTAESSDSGNHAMEVGKALTVEATRTASKITGSSRVTEALGIASGSKITVNISGEAKEIIIDSDTTMSNLAEKFSALGMNATFDANQGRFFLSSKSAGEEHIFTLSDDGSGVLDKLKLNKDATYPAGTSEEDKASYVEGSSAVILYNGAYIKSNSNEMTVNGLSITVKDKTTQKVNITVNNDTQAVYDSVKEFVTEYNKLMTDMYEKYAAESSRGYDPLTDDEKEAMTEKEVENWEKKIKDSLLRRDDTLNSLMSAMRTTMMKSVEVTLKDGTKTKLSLSSIGIVTGNYTEHGLLHIKGDEDDTSYSAETNKLQEWLENDPEAVMQLLAGVENETTGEQEGLGNTLYSDFNTKMRSSTLSSALTFYNDKYMDTQIKSYKEKIDELEDKLVELEDSYYEKFAAMETALSKLNTQSSYLTNMFGGGTA